MSYTEKYATTCHFRVSPVSGKFTVAEYVCFVSPFGFEGRSLRLTGGGMTALGSDALRALDISVSWGDKRIWKLRKPTFVLPLHPFLPEWSQSFLRRRGNHLSFYFGT